MSDGQDRQEKTFDPTPTRIRKAREEGNVFRSQEVVSVGMLTVGVAAFAFGTPFAFEVLKGMSQHIFASVASTPLTILSVPVLTQRLAIQLTLVLAPYFLLLGAAAVGLNALQFGWNLTSKPLMPKGSRISPLKGLKRIFSAQGLFTVAKSVLKIAIVGPIAYVTIQSYLPEILLLHTLPLEEIMGRASQWYLVLLMRLIVVLILLSLVDFFFEKWRYKRDLKMSAKEMKDEQKEQEGDPHVKGKRRELAMKMRRRQRLDHAVLQADVVVTNPTHYAVALKYDPSVSDAPRVLVKGIRKRALHIKALALEHGIPTVEDRPLARALYDGVPELEQIPEELYPAVAALLAEIYRRRDRR